MLKIKPDYYDGFVCIGGECTNTCCSGWQIMIDEESLERYRKEEGDYASTLRESIDWEEKSFKQKADGRCAFLREDNLCQMYRELGEESLCRTCTLYPRHIEEFEDVREYSLSLSCPEVAKNLLNRKEKVTFIEEETGEEAEEFDDYDPFLYSILSDARIVMIDILQNRNLPMTNRIILCTGLAWDMQNRISAGKMFSCSDVIEKYRKQAFFAAAGGKSWRLQNDWRRRYTFSRRMFRNFYELELMQTDWDNLMMEAESCLFGHSVRGYKKLQMEFTEWVKNHFPEWNVIAEQLMVYYVYTYFCGAVYDSRVFVNLQLSAGIVSFVWDLSLARWVRNEQVLDMEDMEDLIERLSRELEHSQNNMIGIWRMLDKQITYFC